MWVCTLITYKVSFHQTTHTKIQPNCTVWPCFAMIVTCLLIHVYLQLLSRDIPGSRTGTSSRIGHFRDQTLECIRPCQSRDRLSPGRPVNGLPSSVHHSSQFCHRFSPLKKAMKMTQKSLLPVYLINLETYKVTSKIIHINNKTQNYILMCDWHIMVDTSIYNYLNAEKTIFYFRDFH